jgi:hypothetical protein
LIGDGSLLCSPDRGTARLRNQQKRPNVKPILYLTASEGWLMPRFSVLMPTHNRPDVIGFAIRSVLAQTETDFELLIVGDGCTDATTDVVAQYKDERIHWFDLPKAPYSGYANRNYALRRARGKFVAYAQDDDLMLPDHLALTGEVMNSGKDWAYSRPLWVTTDGIIVPCGTNLTIPTELDFFLEGRNTIPSNCVVHRRNCFTRFGYWPEDTPRTGDWQLWRKIIRGCGSERIGFLPKPTTLHFSALWKESRHSGVPEVLTWLNIIDRRGWWPPVLRHSVTGPRQEQRVLSEALDNGGTTFVSELRDATATVIGHQGWDSILNLVPRLADAEIQLSQRDAALESANAEVANLHGQAAQNLAGAEIQLAQRDAALESANAKVADLHRQLAQSLAEAESQLSRRDAAVESAKAEVANLQQQLVQNLAEAETKLSRRDAELESANAEVADLRRQLAQHLAETKIELSRCDAALESANTEIANLHRRLAQNLAEAETQLLQRDAAMEAANAEVTKLRRQLTQNLAEAEIELSRREAALVSANAEVANLHRQLAQKDASLLEALEVGVVLQTRLDAVFASRTWRVMEPARSLRRLLARLGA